MTSLCAQWQRRREGCGFPAPVRCGMVSLREVALNGFLDLVARDRADDLLGDLPALEDEQGWDAADVELSGGVGIFVDVQFHDFNFSRVGGGDLGYGRSQHQTRSAPLRPEIDHNGLGLARLDDFGLKRAVRYIANIICHVNPFRWELRATS